MLKKTARSFARKNSIPYQSQKTIFKILPNEAKVAVDVSWISPFPHEQEVIVKIYDRFGFYDPFQFYQCLKSCKSNLDCHHTRNTLKLVTIAGQWCYLSSLEKWNRFMLRKVLSKFKKKLQKGSQTSTLEPNIQTLILMEILGDVSPLFAQKRKLLEPQIVHELNL